MQTKLSKYEWDSSVNMNKPKFLSMIFSSKNGTDLCL